MHLAAPPRVPPKTRKTLCVIQEKQGSAPVFVLVLAGYGDAFAAVELGRGLGPTETLIALQPPDDDAAFAAVANVPALADLYVRKLKEVRPHGPYVLTGYSAGALFALEMARQLGTEGESVPLLVLLDPLIVRYSPFERWCYDTMKRTVKKFRPVAQRSRQYQILLAMVQDKGLDRHLQALSGYHPQPYGGRVLLVEGRWSHFLRTPTFIRGWRRIAQRGLERHRARGDHHSFMRPPHVAKLGRLLVDLTAGATKQSAE